MQASQPADGYAVYTHSNGSIIRLSFPNIADNGQRTTDNLHTIVEVTSKGTSKEKEHILQNLNFNKAGGSYEQKSVGFTTRCTFGPHGTLILTRISKKRE